MHSYTHHHMMATLTREQLEKFVEERPHLQDNLRCRNILRDYENNQVSHTLSSTIEKILWKKRQSNLSQKLENRPNLEQLEQRGILPYHISSGYTSSSNSNRSSSVEQQTSSSPSSTSSSNSVSDNTPLHQDFSYIYDQEQALSGIGLGREEKERKKRHIENFLVRRPSKKDLVEMLRKGNSMALHSNLSQVDNEPTLIYDVSGTTSNDLSHASPTTFPSFDPMCILLEPHVLQIHNQLENLQSVTDTESSDDSNNNSESEDEEKGSTSQ